MLKNPDLISARDVLLRTVKKIGMEEIPLWECAGRILAEDVNAKQQVPPFPSSPYDGYAFRSKDSTSASLEHPVTLRIIEEVPAGSVPSKICTEKTAVKILTGAPIPEGADTVRMYEETKFSADEVTIFSPALPGENVIPAGQQIREGDLLAEKGSRIHPKMIGTLASQGISYLKVYRIPKIGILPTGSEVTEIGGVLKPGKIYDANSYTLAAALKENGCEPVYLGQVADSSSEICRMFEKGLAECDAVISTGGVCVGDYDLTPEAMEMAGIHLLFRGIDLKPGAACAYGEKDGRMVCALSGSPVSSLMNFYALALPALKKFAGLHNYMPEEVEVTLRTDFKRRGSGPLLLNGKLDFSGGTVGMVLPGKQGNTVSEDIQNLGIFTVVPADVDFIAAGTILRGIRI